VLAGTDVYAQVKRRREFERYIAMPRTTAHDAPCPAQPSVDRTGATRPSSSVQLALERGTWRDLEKYWALAFLDAETLFFKTVATGCYARFVAIVGEVVVSKWIVDRPTSTTL
jgi:hypothetical protein